MVKDRAGLAIKTTYFTLYLSNLNPELKAIVAKLTDLWAIIFQN